MGWTRRRTGGSGWGCLAARSLGVFALTAIFALGAFPVGPVHAAAGVLPDAPMNADALEGECDVEGLDDRCEAWTAAGAAGDQLVVSPDGERMFTWGGGATVAAHNAAAGELEWTAELEGISDATADVEAVAVSPDGRRVYAVGDDIARDALHSEDRDVVVAAYDATDGSELWHTSLGLPAIDENDRYVSRERVAAVAASPDGRRVYLTGDTRLYDRIGPGAVRLDDALIAGFDAATGAEAWVATWGDKGEAVHGTRIAVSHDSSTVYVGGTYGPCDGSNCPRDLLAVGVRAYHPGAPAQEGTVLWHATYGVPDARIGLVSMELGPSGQKLYLLGNNWATVAYRTADGGELWASRYIGPPDDRPDPVNRRDPYGPHQSTGLAVSPAGDTVLVAGTFYAHALVDNDVQKLRLGHESTVAYDAQDGAELWIAQFKTVTSAAAPVQGPQHANPQTQGRGVDVSPDGQTAYVLGHTSEGQVTVEYDTLTGAQRWIARLPRNVGQQVAVNPTGAFVYTLSSGGSIHAYDARA